MFPVHQSAICHHFIFLTFSEKTTSPEKGEKKNFTHLKDNGKFIV
jgi:hypothetical protein